MDINSFVIGLAKGKKSGSGYFSTKENDAGGLTYAFKAKESEGGGSMEGFHMVRFFNDDRTTLLYTVFVPTGSSVIYAGEMPVSTEDSTLTFVGFAPSAENITADLDCYATYVAVSTLEETSWEVISILSADGTANNYFAVGDTKMIHIEGTVGTLEVNGDYGVYILGFDHNEKLEGKGIHFGTFKSASGVNLALVDSKYGEVNDDGTKYFNMNHWGNYNYGGWAGCDMRYDILGSTDKAPSGYGAAKTTSVVGYDPSSTCATTPVAGTLMAALPADLRAVMKPMTKYTDGKGNYSNTEANVVATIDYLPLLAEFEIFGVREYANQYEQNKQKQYDYFVDGNSKVKYKHSDNATTSQWLGRSARHNTGSGFNYVDTTGVKKSTNASFAIGLAPIFKV